MRPNQLFIVLCAFCFGALLALWLFALENQPKKVKVEQADNTLIGAPFRLTSHEGKTVSSEDFKGKYMLIYFGYSFCPDVCPTDLQKMARALDLAKQRAEKIQPIFITIDPERDTPEQLKSYVSNFHPNLLGLAGTMDQTETLKKGFKIYAVKVDENGKPANNMQGDDYLMDHSPQTFMMGPDGKFIRYFRYSTTAETMAAALKKIIPAN